MQQWPRTHNSPGNQYNNSPNKVQRIYQLDERWKAAGLLSPASISTARRRFTAWRTSRNGQRPAHQTRRGNTYPVQLVEHLYGGRPVDTCVGDRDAVLERSRALGRDVLASGIDVRLDHDARDSPVACDELLADVVDDPGLVVVVLLRVAVWCAQTRTCQFRDLDVRGCEKTLTTAVDHD